MHSYTKDDKAFWARFNLFSFLRRLDDCYIIIMADSNDAFERFFDRLEARCTMRNEKLDANQVKKKVNRKKRISIEN